MTFRTETIGDATLILGDCREVLPTLQRVDAVVTDPPYNCGKDYGAGHDDELGPEEYKAWLASVWSALPTDTLVYSPGDRHLWDAPAICAAAGFRLGRPLAWHRKEFAGDKFNAGPAMCWEPIIWAMRGEKRYAKIFGHQGRDHLTVNCTRLTPHRDEHPCPKPLEVMTWLVGLFGGESVLDPFMGTGTTAIACMTHGVAFIGIEQNQLYFDIACKRIEEAWKQPRLFEEPRPKPVQEALL